MNLRIIPYTLIILLFLSPTAQQVKAEGNMTLPPTNMTTPIPFNATIGNTTITNSTLSNSTMTNSTTPDANTTQPQQLSGEKLAELQTMADDCFSLMYEILGDNPLTPETTNGRTHAEQAMTKAMNFEENNNPAAAQQYLHAMKHARNTIRKFLKDNPVIEVELESEVNGTATDDINGTVSGAELSLAQMQLIGEFEERFREQVRAMIMNVNDLSEDMSAGDVEKAHRALEKAEAKLQRIQQRIQNGEYDMALDYLENATNGLSEDFDDSEDPGTAQMLRTMYRFEARIQKLEQKAAKKAAKGLSTDDEDALLAELRGNKDHTKHEFKTYGKGKGNGGPVKEKSNNGKGND